MEALKAGVLWIEMRGDVAGLVLNGFAAFNENLLPGYVSMQKRGGLAAGEARRRKADGPATHGPRLSHCEGKIWDYDGFGRGGTNCDKMRRNTVLYRVSPWIEGDELRQAEARPETEGIYTGHIHHIHPFSALEGYGLEGLCVCAAQFQAETGGSDARFEARARVGSGGVREDDAPAGDDRGGGADIRALCGEQVGDYGVASPQELVKINLGEP